MTPPPYIRRRMKSSGLVKYVLVEPSADEHGRAMNQYHQLGITRDPWEALAGMIERLRERESWAGSNPSEEEAGEIAVAQEKIDALTIAIAKMDAKE
jgi:hypothetical protein